MENPLAYHDTLTIRTIEASSALHYWRYTEVDMTQHFQDLATALDSRCSYYLHLPRLIVHHLDPIRYFSGKLHELLVRWILVHVVVAILGILKLDDETVGRVALHSSADWRILGRYVLTYSMAFRAVVLSTGEGLDVWFL